MTQRERMCSGALYDAGDSELAQGRARAKALVHRYNQTTDEQVSLREELLGELLGGMGEDVWIVPPFRCDYGFNIEVGKNFFANYNCTIIDVAKVKIGDNCQMAPNVAVYTAGHPIHPDTRNTAYEYGKEVTIGDNCWIGGNSVICPGVHIGNNVVIGAGSVVTKDIPDWSIAAGNPCKVIRKITEDDRRKLFHNEEIDNEAWTDILSRSDSSDR